MDFRRGPKDDECVASRISFTVYLNDDFEGGETAFVTGVRDDGSHGGEHYPNRPRTGSAVLFYQCVPEFSHTANEVRGGCRVSCVQMCFIASPMLLQQMLGVGMC